MELLAVANRKGGVGKSTFTVHCAHCAVEQGRRVLVVDFDDQLNATLWFADQAPVFFHASALFGAWPAEFNEAARGASLAVAAADNVLMDADNVLPADALPTAMRAAARLREAAADFDLCIIDCPTAAGVRPMAAMMAADYVVTPFQLTAFAMQGVESMIQVINTVRRPEFNPRMTWLGILPNLYNVRSKAQQDALAELMAAAPQFMMRDKIRRSAAIEDAPAHRRPVWKGVKGTSHRTAANEMRAACETVLERIFQ